MIDPSSIISIIPAEGNGLIKITNIPECDYEVYNIYDDKDFKKYIADIEKEVRQSFEYRQYINYIRDYMNMNECALLEDVHTDGSFKVKIEQHHYPFALYDIVLIVFNKRMYYHESLDLEEVAKEVMKLHYELIIGLIPLSETVHQLVHNKYVFIPIQNVLGRYRLFVDSYKDFMLPEHLDVLNRIEEYSISFAQNNKNNGILKQHKLFLDTSVSYKLPDLSNVAISMSNRIKTIKDNRYQLPVLTKSSEEDNRVTNKQLKNAIKFF